MLMIKLNNLWQLSMLIVMLLLAGCSSSDSELESSIKSTAAEYRLCVISNRTPFRTGTLNIDRDWNYLFEAWISRLGDCSDEDGKAEYIKLTNLRAGPNILGGRECKNTHKCRMIHKLDNDIGFACFTAVAKVPTGIFRTNSCKKSVLTGKSTGPSFNPRPFRLKNIN